MKKRNVCYSKHKKKMVKISVQSNIYPSIRAGFWQAGHMKKNVRNLTQNLLNNYSIVLCSCRRTMRSIWLCLACRPVIFCHPRIWFIKLSAAFVWNLSYVESTIRLIVSDFHLTRNFKVHTASTDDLNANR